MKIIIAGAGEVGFHLAKLLSYESQDITLIDTNKETLKRIFRTDLSSVGKNTMNITPRAKNLKNKSNTSLLPKITKASAEQVSTSSGSSFLNSNPNSLEKRQPIKSDKKVGRNEPCPCNSGKKYKKCHGE